jgi:hypothetical protein
MAPPPQHTLTHALPAHWGQLVTQPLLLLLQLVVVELMMMLCWLHLQG